MTTLQHQARALGDPTRHAVFEYLLQARRPVGVAELTGHFGLNHNAIRQHLTKLHAAGLVDEAVVPTGGPGRPRLMYEVAPTARGRWGPEGAYERLALLLAEVVKTGDDPVEVGRRAGRSLRGERGDVVADLVAAMASQGFAPEARPRGKRVDVVLHECPFAAVAAVAPEVVCQLHLGLAEGLTDGSDVTVEELVAKDPRRAGCRVRVTPS